MLKWIFISFVCFAPILEPVLPKTQFGSGFPDIGIVRLIGMMLILVYLFEIILARKIAIFNKWIITLSLYSVVVIASISWSNYEYDPSMIRYLFDKVIMLLLVSIIALKIFMFKENIDSYMRAMCISAFFVSLSGIIEIVPGPFYHLIFGGANTEISRATGIYANPNTLAIYIVITIPCILYCYDNKLLPNIIIWLLSAFVMGGLISTISRKGIITAGLTCIIFFFLKKQYKKLLISGILIILIAVLLSGIAVISGRFEENTFQRDIEGKWNLAHAGLKMFVSSPLIGLGFDGYPDNYKKYFPTSSHDSRPAHNMFVTVLAEFGLIGFIPFILIFFYPLILSIKNLRKKEKFKTMNFNTVTTDLSIFCIATIIPFMINGSFQGGLLFNEYLVTILYTNIIIFLCSISPNYNYSSE